MNRRKKSARRIGEKKSARRRGEKKIFFGAAK